MLHQFNIAGVMRIVVCSNNPYTWNKKTQSFTYVSEFIGVYDMRVNSGETK